jgi:transposase
MSKYTKYDEAFKKNAVGLVASGQKASVVARDLGLHVETLYQWVRKYHPAKAEAPAASNGSAAKELEALRKENELLKMERDILKKAVGIFSRPPR